MAKQGAKKRKEENSRHMNNLRRFIMACNVIFLVVRAGYFYSTFDWKQCIGVILTSLTYFVAYEQLASMAKPSYDDNGELQDGGFDMSTTGVCGYIHDIIYITGFVQLGSIISGKFWYTYLVIPGFGAYKCIELVKGAISSSSGSEGPQEDEKMRKKREKLEKRASRTKIVRTRAR